MIYLFGLWAIVVTILLVQECRAHADTRRDFIEWKCKVNIAKVIDDRHVEAMKPVASTKRNPANG